MAVTPERRPERPSVPGRWEVPEIDAAALRLARLVRRAVEALRAADRPRWAAVLEPLLEPLQDGDLVAVRAAANRTRAAFGVGESVADDLPAVEARGLREATDAVLRALDRHEAATLGSRRSASTTREPGSP